MDKKDKNNVSDQEVRVSKKTLLLTMLMLLVLVVLVVGVTYQVYMYSGSNETLINKIIGREPIIDNNTNTNTETNTNTNTNTNRNTNNWWWPFTPSNPTTPDDGKVTITYNETDNFITITNAVPMSDEAGKIMSNSDEYMDFTVDIKMTKKASIKYQVVADKEKDSTIKDSEIRLYLERSDDGLNYQEVMEPTAYIPLAINNEFGSKKGNMVMDEVVVNGTKTYYYRLRMWLASDYHMTIEPKTFRARVNVNAVSN